MRTIGFDIGGANIKAADNDGHCVSRAFEIWKTPDRLRGVLAEIVAGFKSCDALAVTMTAELADCFETKAEGVDSILLAVEHAAPQVPVEVWQTGAEFVSPAVAREIPLLVAAANWHALATWVGRMAPEGAALVIDIGTTTTDLIPLWNGVPVPRGLTDSERLQFGELVYTGVRRTPVCAVAQTVQFREGMCSVAAELFATTLDVYLLLGQIAEDANDCHTANGRPATRTAAVDRLARMLCCDRTELTADDACQIAEHVAAQQRSQIAAAIEKVLQNQNSVPRAVILSGSGEFLGREIVNSHQTLKDATITSLSSTLGPELAETACAFAVSRLASEFDR